MSPIKSMMVQCYNSWLGDSEIAGKNCDDLCRQRVGRVQKIPSTDEKSAKIFYECVQRCLQRQAQIDNDKLT